MFCFKTPPNWCLSYRSTPFCPIFFVRLLSSVELRKMRTFLNWMVMRQSSKQSTPWTRNARYLGFIFVRVVVVFYLFSINGELLDGTCGSFAERSLGTYSLHSKFKCNSNNNSIKDYWGAFCGLIIQRRLYCWIYVYAEK